MPPSPADPSAAAENRDRAARRARGQLRRYAVSNGCTRLVTLTYRPPQPTDPDVVLADVQRFERRLNARYPGLAYARVFERHKSGTLHVHLVANKPFPDERRRRTLARLWGHGFVDVRRLGRPGEGARERARSAARYAAKYATKGSVSGFGRHSYEVRQGFQPASRRLIGWSRDDAWRAAVLEMGGELPAYEWRSTGVEGWRGPPVEFLSWG